MVADCPQLAEKAAVVVAACVIEAAEELVGQLAAVAALESVNQLMSAC